MNKIIKIFKNNYKIVIGLILGIIISGISVYAVENIAMIDSNEVSYDNSESHGTKENVQESIDELYERSGVKTTKWVDPILNGADPVLSKEGSEQSLIPVTIDSGGTVRYANEYTEWYNYSEKRWANAVILVSSPSKKYTTGDVILEQDIESYFVWIPRYKYKVWDLGNYTSSIPGDSLANIQDDTGNQYAINNFMKNDQIIDVEFGDTTNVTVGGDTKKSGTSGGTGINVGEYLIHPAFTLGNTELNGIWVGKFETGYNQDGDNGSPITPEDWTTQGAEQESENPKRIIIKSNVYSWRNIAIKDMFLSAYNYHRSDYNSHMMKNTEWGAVAYLSHSAYGIGTEVNVNNNKTYKTGYSSYNVDQSTTPGTESTGKDGKSKEWDTPTGFLASTTGNIAGVYDLSGGAWEYMAAYTLNSHSGDKSGFNEEEITDTYKDYIDQYVENYNNFSYNNRILGDATGEMGPFFTFKESNGTDSNHSSWYSDNSYFATVSYPWFIRGGRWDAGSVAGQFHVTRNTGNAGEDGGFRVVLSIG